MRPPSLHPCVKSLSSLTLSCMKALYSALDSLCIYHLKSCQDSRGMTFFSKSLILFNFAKYPLVLCVCFVSNVIANSFVACYPGLLELG